MFKLKVLALIYLLMNLTINEDIKKLLPPLSQEEYRILEESIICDGCRHPLITWQGILVDGHNRYEICRRHNIQYLVEELDAVDFDSIKVWVIDNQKGRRNLTDGWKFELVQVRKEILKQQGRENLKTNIGGNHMGLSTVDKGTHNTRNEIAEELGWSTGKVAMADKVWSEANPEIKDKVKSGDMSINQAYKEVKRDEKIENIKNKKLEYDERINRKSQSIDIYKVDKKYRIIYADPPWSYNDKCEKGGVQSGGVEVKFYNVMSVGDICFLPINKMIENDAVLFLWVTSPLLPDAMKVIHEWGFVYKASFVWDKIKHNMGHYNSVRHEFLLVATRGSCVPDVCKLVDSVYCEERTEHSKKPDYFRNLIDELYTYGSRIELFAREEYPGWDKWGNEVWQNIMRRNYSKD